MCVLLTCLCKSNSSAERLKCFSSTRLSSVLRTPAKEIFCDEMMFLALISTACISNVIYSLQAMLIYARITNAMDGEAIILFKYFSVFVSFCGNAVLSCVFNTKDNQNVSREGLL